MLSRWRSAVLSGTSLKVSPYRSLRTRRYHFLAGNTGCRELPVSHRHLYPSVSRAIARVVVLVVGVANSGAGHEAFGRRVGDIELRMRRVRRTIEGRERVMSGGRITDPFLWETFV